MNNEEFWCRKEQELEYLSRYAGSQKARTPAADFEAFRNASAALRKQIQLRQIEQIAALPETSPVGPERFPSPGGPVMYGYQRYDLRRVDIKWLKELYFCSVEKRFADGLFLACGMSAISALFAIFTRRGWQSVQFSPVPYFESYLLAKRFFGQISFDQSDEQFSPDRDVLWLDTASLSWPTFPESIGSIRLIVVDTTCVEPDNAAVVRWLNESARLGCVLVLVRSHVKLDSFGLELGRLGSAIVIAPDLDRGEAEAFIQELLQARSGFGLGFTLSSLYPWLGDPEFAELARLRTDAIRNVTISLSAALRAESQPGDRYEVLPTTHGIFLVIRTHLDIGSDVSQQNSKGAIQSFVLSRRIAALCKENNLPVNAAASFGLDQITLNDFVNLFDGQHHLRISSADIPHHLIPTVAKCIRQVLVDFESMINGA